MRRSSATKSPVLEILGRPEGGPGGTRPAVGPPGGTAQAKREAIATLHEAIARLIELTHEPLHAQRAAADQNRPLLLNGLEAAKLLSVSRSKVLDLAARGEIPSMRVGGSVRIPRDRLIEWIEERTHLGYPTPARRLPEWAQVDRTHER
jgi:excisionase family DNA binding protein